MDRLGVQMRTWVLLVTLGCLFVGQAVAGPQYLVSIPALLESGEPIHYCVRLLTPNETLVVTVSISSQTENRELFRRETSEAFELCDGFKAPVVANDEVQNITVEVTGQTFHSKKVSKVYIQVIKPVSFIQSDKPIYLPGQTVDFRVVSLDTKLRPACRKYDIIEVEDSHGNRIGQWLNQTSAGRILQLAYSLNSEVKEGTFTINVLSGEDRFSHNFKVEKYVLPKFDVKITADDQVSVAKPELSVKVCAKYTYGQPVPGIMKIDVCRPFNRYIERITEILPDGVIREVPPPCYKETKQLDGCETLTIPMSTFIKIDPKSLQDTLEIYVKVEEEGTGLTHTQNSRVSISYAVGKLSFFDTSKIYDKDSNIEGKVRALRYDDVPLAEKDLFLFVGERWSSRRVQNLTTDENGEASFSVDTTGYSGDLHLWISDTPELEYPGYRVEYIEDGDITVSMSQQSSPDSKTVSFLKVKKNERKFLCGAVEDIDIEYAVVQEAQGPLNIFYMVIGNNDILAHGEFEIFVTGDKVTEGRVPITLGVTPLMARDFVVLTFAILPSYYVIAHSAKFNTEKCFNHKVGVQFDPEGGVPGESATLQVTGHAHSLCGLSVIDQSVLIQEPGKHLKAEKIFDMLPSKRYVPYQAQDATTCLPVRPKRSVIFPPYPYPENADDAFTVFQNAGLKVLTNLNIRVPECLSYMGREFHHGRPYVVAYDHRVEDVALAMAGPGGGPAGGVGAGLGAPLLPIETVRTFFPETWIWDLVEIGESGKADKAVTVPDTITTWETETFCLSGEGFGLAPRTQFTVFQPFFLELSLPYSSIRGEQFELIATVFSYLESCMMVAVVTPPSQQYDLTPVDAADNNFCLCGRERKTITWNMTPKALGKIDVTVQAEAVASSVSCNNEVVTVPERGRIDVVTRKLRVKAEGLEVMKSYNLLLCPKGIKPEKNNTVEDTIAVQFPDNVIEGSSRALVSVIGDIMGRALKNLDGLLRMPYGCGEQNMLLFVPNIYIMEYLTQTGQLTPEIKTKAENFLVSGYQRQLNYKHADGSYSAFGLGDGNTWLTAFVLRSFAKAQKFIYIDPAKIDEARQWLESKQMPNGCFQKSGQLFHKEMKGGVSDEVTLSAYVTATLLEMEIPADNEVLMKSLNCLKAAEGVKSNTYTSALLSYVFTLAQESGRRQELLDHLDIHAHQEGGLLYWSKESEVTSASLSVEMSSYVMLAKLGSHLASAIPSQEELGYAAKIVRWLMKQQNYYGGYSSTQDTVVALQALTRYATLLGKPEGPVTVTVRSQSGPQLVFEVNQFNRLLYQEKTLADTAGAYEVEATGKSCAAVQITAFYNIPVPKEASPFTLDVTPEANCDSNALRPRMNLNIRAEYNGAAEETNMVVIDIKVLTGFRADDDSLKALREAPSVKRVDLEEDHVLIYIEKVAKNSPLSFKLLMIRERQVYQLKPGVVKVYDYYQPDDKFDTEYAYCPKD